jgi:hypothetical protein
VHAIGRNEDRFSQLDFSSFIAERTRHFTGRRWVEAAIDVWLSDRNAPTYFILTGDPGVGKSAFAAHIVRSRPHRVSAYHFCSARLGGWIDPLAFCRSISHQLAARIDEFAERLLEPEGIHIEATQRIQHLTNGQAVNVLIENFTVGGPENAFDRLVRAPLQRLKALEWSEPILLLVDGLDEALAYTGNCTIADLLSRSRDLPDFFRCIVTSRAERRVLCHWDDIPHFRIHASGEENVLDIREYVGLRLGELPKPCPNEIADKVAARSAGNFLYVSHLMDSAIRDPSILDAPDDLPEGLDGVYRLFLNMRDIGRDLTRWEDRYQPVLGVLSVAREPLSEAFLQQYTGLDGQRIAAIVRELWQYLSLEPQLEHVAYRIYHQSFVDFLLNRKRSKDHWLDASVWHQRIAQSYYPNGFQAPSAPATWDGYGLRNLVEHLGAGRLLPSMFALVEDDRWYKRKLELDDSGASYAADIDRALLAAGQDPKMVADLVAYSLLYATITEPLTNPRLESLAALVKEGRASEALAQVQWIIRPAQRCLAYQTLAQALSGAEQPAEAEIAWDCALAELDKEGNPVRAADAGRSLCLALLASQKGDKSQRALAATRKHIARIPNDSTRLSKWQEMATALVDAQHIHEVRTVIEAFLSDLEFMPHRVYVFGGGSHEDTPYTHYMGVASK